MQSQSNLLPSFINWFLAFLTGIHSHRPHLKHWHLFWLRYADCFAPMYLRRHDVLILHYQFWRENGDHISSQMPMMSSLLMPTRRHSPTPCCLLALTGRSNSPRPLPLMPFKAVMVCLRRLCEYSLSRKREPKSIWQSTFWRE